MQPPIPLPVLVNLKCAHCRRFVTSGPVFVVPDSSILCGRCSHFAKKIYRNFAFEAVASIFYYPCHYWPRHCNKKLKWGESRDHEKNCTYDSSCSLFCSKPGSLCKSDRKLPTSGGVNLEAVPEDVLERLTCAACQCYLSNSPIYILPDGKNICHRCYHSNGTPNDGVRNLAYEAIASALLFPCIYRFRGCVVGIKFGRESWEHEHQCAHAPAKKEKKASTSGKERGVIQTHSGHIYGTITPHSALFAPPTSSNAEGKIFNQEITEVLKKKHKEDETKSFDDAQSIDSIMSKRTFESLDISVSLGDNISRDNISTRDNISRDNVSRDNISRTSTRPSVREQRYYYPHQPRPSSYDLQHGRMRRPDDDVGNFLDEIVPTPRPPGFNKFPHNSFYQDNIQFYPPQSRLSHSNSFNNYPPGVGGGGSHLQKSESLKVGNQGLINELKERQLRRNNSKREENPFGRCNNLQDIVQVHEEVFDH